MSHFLLCVIRELAAEEEEEEDEGIGEQNPESITADAAEVPKDENKEGNEEDDELAEYGLDKYDEEDTGEGMFTPCSLCLFSVHCVICRGQYKKGKKYCSNLKSYKYVVHKISSQGYFATSFPG